MNVSLDDTICGVATPRGEGGVGIIRVSGKQALSIAEKIVKLRSGRSMRDVATHHMYLADVVWNGEETNGNPLPGFLDEAFIVMMRSPHSYTGEDVVEIQTHGGPFILRTTCGALIREGARLAEPGEFTKRAFLNGRLDLTQAEAVLDTIRAATEGSLKTAQNQLRGRLGEKIGVIRDALITVLAHLEAGMDFVEEDIHFIQAEEMTSKLTSTLEHIARLESTFKEGRIFRDGVYVALVGRPNVGKSSLLNALLGADRAIVSSIPGTTRDIVDDIINIGDIPVRLVDTAGLRESRDPIEEEGIRRTKGAIEQADLLLVVMDGSEPLCDEDRILVTQCSTQPMIVVINKVDLPSHIIPEDILPLMKRAPLTRSGETGEKFPLVWISATSGVGLDTLKEEIRSVFLTRDFEPGSSVLVTQVRHQQALRRAGQSIEHALRSVEGHMPGEFIALDLRDALDALGEITGVVTHEDILDKIFQDFCIGK